ncbi:MAG TPA: hypothetical protein VIB48_04565 [Acidimicrobiia bacterium]
MTRQRPLWVRLAWLALWAAAVVLVIHGITGFGDEHVHSFLDNWVSDAAVWVAGVVCLVGAARAERGRAAWYLVGAALVAWAIGDTIWSIRGDPGSVVSVSDVFWLAWYPLLVVALVLLVRDRVPAFELHRWIDGVVVMLLVATPWVALFLEPAARHSHTSALGAAVDFAYPLGDAIIVGATLGVIALMGWRPGQMWIALGIGFTALGIADAVYSVDALGHTYTTDTTFDALWIVGLVLIAYAAWLPHPGELEPERVTGWRAIALPLAAQFVAISLQVYGFFFDLPRSERIFTIVVLLIATAQIIVTRPRPEEVVVEADGELVIHLDEADDVHQPITGSLELE